MHLVGSYRENVNGHLASGCNVNQLDVIFIVPTEVTTQQFTLEVEYCYFRDEIITCDKTSIDAGPVESMYLPIP